MNDTAAPTPGLDRDPYEGGVRSPGPPDPYHAVAARLVQPLHAAWRRDRSRRHLPRVERILDLPRSRSEAWTLARVRKLLCHAEATVPFWRERMTQAGFVPRRMRSLDELERLPPLRREDVARHASDFLSSRHRGRPLLEAQSGGTTTRPLTFVQDMRAAWCKMAATHALRRRMGWELGQRAAVLWVQTDRPPEARTFTQRLRRSLQEQWLVRGIWLAAEGLSEGLFEDHVATLARFRPAVLQAYPSAADLLARYLLDRGRRLVIPRVLLTAETTFDAQRRRIAEAFSAEVFTFYGAREVGWIAEECPAEHRLHVNTAGVHLEVGDDGRLLVTDLVDAAAPLFRYEVGDRGRLDDAPCPCGDPRPVLAELHGRVTDVLRTPSGRAVPGVMLDARNWLIDEGLFETQLVQTARGALLVRWVAAPTYREGHLEGYRAFLNEYLHGELDITFEQVERIEPEPNGKVRYCISLPEGSEA